MQTKNDNQPQIDYSQPPYPNLTYPYVLARDELGEALQRKFGDKFATEFADFVKKTDAILGMEAKPKESTNLPDLIGASHAAENMSYSGGSHTQQQYERTLETTMGVATGKLNEIKQIDDKQNIPSALNDAAEFLSAKLKGTLKHLDNLKVQAQQAQQQSRDW